MHQQGLRQWGYVNGQNVVVEFRFTDGSVDQLPQLAEDLVRLRVAAILASAAPAAQAAKKTTTLVPVIFVVSNPVKMGLVPGLAHPGGNVTGLAFNSSSDPGGKRLEILKELVPTVGRVVVLWDRENPNNPVQLKEAQIAARALGMQPEPVSVSGPRRWRGTEPRAITHRHHRERTYRAVHPLPDTNEESRTDSWRFFAEPGGLIRMRAVL
jgi:putative tryptophan/tyrosine transport system substrate-binding protein